MYVTYRKVKFLAFLRLKKIEKIYRVASTAVIMFMPTPVL